jgi:Helix-turn-helix domain
MRSQIRERRHRVMSRGFRYSPGWSCVARRRGQCYAFIVMPKRKTEYAYSAAHKIQLLPTEEQERYLWRCVGAARFVWNWALAEWEAGLR